MLQNLLIINWYSNIICIEIPHFCNIWKDVKIELIHFINILHPSKKVTQHDFDRLYLFYPGFVFIKLIYPGKPVYLPFEWCLICLDCFTEVCVGWVNWGKWQKGRLAKLIGFYGKCVLCLVSCFPFVSACTHTRCARAHSLYRNPPKQNIMLNFK